LCAASLQGDWPPNPEGQKLAAHLPGGNLIHNDHLQASSNIGASALVLPKTLFTKGRCASFKVMHVKAVALSS
jgi:hypothetical protein